MAPQDEDEEAAKKDSTKKLLAFVKRQDASTRSDRADKDYAQKKRDYELRLDRLQCRNCGTFQSYDEFIDKRTKCPADICETGFYYAPQQVFNRDLVGDFKKLINKALAEFTGNDVTGAQGEFAWEDPSSMVSQVPVETWESVRELMRKDREKS